MIKQTVKSLKKFYFTVYASAISKRVTYILGDCGKAVRKPGAPNGVRTREPLNSRS